MYKKKYCWIKKKNIVELKKKYCCISISILLLLSESISRWHVHIYIPFMATLRQHLTSGYVLYGVAYGCCLLMFILSNCCIFVFLLLLSLSCPVAMQQFRFVYGKVGEQQSEQLKCDTEGIFKQCVYIHAYSYKHI